MMPKTQRTCPSCGNELSGAMEFCPVCLLRKGLAGGIESGESSVTPTPDQAEQRFEHYKLVTGEDGKPVELGRGAMGVTYKAVDVDLHCPATVKVISEKYLGDESARLRFLREARAAASVRHPECCLGLPPGQNRSELLFAGETRRSNLRRIPQAKSERLRRTWIPTTSLVTSSCFLNRKGIESVVSGTDRFRAARDFLLANRTDYDVAYRGFQWPELDRFNWALDWFDSIAAGERCDQPALWVTFEDGKETKLSFRQLSNRSSQIANYYRELGIGRGDRVMVMLGNVPPLWETVLALIKLGAVILPATTLLGEADLADRIERGRVRHIVCSADCISRFDQIGKHCTRIVVGGPVLEWHSYEDGYAASPEFEPDGDTRSGDPMQLYFTSGTTSKPKLVMHTHVTYPVGHLSTMYWIGLRPGDIHCNVSSPGWAKHSWSWFFAPWNAEATVFVPNQPRFNAKGLLESVTRAEVTTLCAPPTVWRMLVTQQLADYKT